LKKLILPVLLLLLCALSSCRVFYPDLMFKTPPDFQFDKPDSTDNKDYVLKPGDALNMSILSNNGYQLVDIIGTTAATVPIHYIIKSNGFATLPLLDSIYIAGLTVLELENYLVDSYGYYFLNPFIQVNVDNRRVMVFNGRSIGQVVTLRDDRVTLTEVLAYARGITGNKAYRIKVIRGDMKNPKVFLFDLSTIEGYKASDFLVTNQDIIYVEPSLTLADVNAKIVPILSTISTILLIYVTVNNAGK